MHEFVRLAVMSLTDDLQNLGPWGIFAIGLGTATVILLLVYFIVFHRYKNSRLKEHNLTINLDGGLFQGSKEEVVFKAKLGQEIDINRIRPVKEGYSFNGFNVYKKFVSSTIREEGLTKSMVTSEELDGVDKSVILMPDYDLYLVAKYSPLSNLQPTGLKDDYYYPDFMNSDDVLADLKHLNFDKANFPFKINFRRSPKVPNMVFVFKDKTLCAMIYPYKCVTKVFLRTSESAEGKLLTPFYESEDINDAMNWYSFVVIYNTKPQRFIRSFKDSYDDVDETLPTTEIEFNLIVGSLSDFADPVLDRAVLLVERYEKDSLLPNPPAYVIKKELPDDLDENGGFKADNPLKEELETLAKEEQLVKEEKKEEPKPAEFKKEEPVPAPVAAAAEKKPEPVVPAKQEEKPAPAEKKPEPVKPIIKPVAPLKHEEVKEEKKPEPKETVKPLDVKPVPSSFHKPIAPIKPEVVSISKIESVKPVPKPAEEKKPEPIKPVAPLAHQNAGPAPKPVSPKKPIGPLSPIVPPKSSSKPIGPVDIKNVSAKDAGLKTAEAPVAPAPDLKPVTKPKHHRHHQAPKKELKTAEIPPVSGQRRVPGSNGPRRKDEPISRQLVSRSSIHDHRH
jgi:hypothetical protein